MRDHIDAIKPQSQKDAAIAAKIEAAATIEGVKKGDIVHGDFVENDKGSFYTFDSADSLNAFLAKIGG